jgi:hypothetical protein
MIRMGQFPIGAGITELRGIIEIIKENGGAINLSKLAEESEEEIDTLLPLLDAGEMLGLVEVKDGIVKLTQDGKALKIGNISNILSKKLKNIEPFKSVLEILDKNELTTPEIAEELRARGIILNADDMTNVELLRNMLVKWTLRTKLLEYNRDSDSWKKRANL